MPDPVTWPVRQRMAYATIGRYQAPLTARDPGVGGDVAVRVDRFSRGHTATT